MSSVREPADSGVTYRDREAVLLPDGSALAVTDAMARLAWQPMLCPTMPHEYVVSTWSSLDRSAFDAILEMTRHSPDAVPAYWRGYQRPTRYWHGPSGFRYWTSPGYTSGSIVLNRTDDIDDTRPVDPGGEPIRDWVGCPWEPQGSHIIRAGGVARRLVAIGRRARRRLPAMPVVPASSTRVVVGRGAPHLAGSAPGGRGPKLRRATDAHRATLELWGTT